MAELLFQGHGSFRIITDNGTVIYFDPYAGKGYDIPADLILITHEHGDHNDIKKVTQKADCEIVRAKDVLISGVYHSLEVKGIHIEAVQAYNKNHREEDSVGYVLTFDGIKLYGSGDTSTTDDMKNKLPAMHLDYALYPTDGKYNMDPEEATKCADMVGAKHSIPIHMKPGELFDRERAELFTANNRLVVEAGETITLRP
ncbi:MAG: MBL fold metallo-hydrolase [Anaerolineaceae bacterium]|nr:MBL fold metallo-hydrolase [Anaerolineaceae bacterium]